MEEKMTLIIINEVWQFTNNESDSAISFLIKNGYPSSIAYSESKDNPIIERLGLNRDILHAFDELITILKTNGQWK